jgi:entericidin A
MEKHMRMRALLALAVGASLLLSACATVKGAGKDIESVGEAGSEAIGAK